LVNRFIYRNRAIGGRDLIVDNLELSRDAPAGGDSTRERKQRQQAVESGPVTSDGDSPKAVLVRDHSRSTV
jgi:hypothetical protein